MLNAYRTSHSLTAAALRKIREEVMIAQSFSALIIVLDMDIVMNSESANAKKITSEKIAVSSFYQS